MGPAGKAAGARILALETAFVEAQENAQAARSEVTRTLAVLGQRDEQMVRAQDAVDAQTLQFEQRLRENGFDSEADFQRARRALAEVTPLDKAIRDYATRLHIARDQ